MSPPKLPQPTCPVINEVQKAIREAIREAKEAKNLDSREEFCYSLDAIIDLLDDSEDNLEYIRDANSSLRECALYWKDEYEKLESL